jgi:hypothetical protein
MNYLNLETNTMRDVAFMSASPVQRGVWLSLMLHCVAVENGGLISGCAEWKSDQWLLICSLKFADFKKASPCGLWQWSGQDLQVWGFPHKSLKKVQANRLNGPKGNPALRQTMGNDMPNHMGGHMPPLMGERNVKEGNGKVREEEGKESTDPAPTPDQTSISSTGIPPEKKERGAGVPANVDEALAYAARYSKGNAEMLVIEDASVRNWHDDRSTCNWEPVRSGVQVAITDWKADLRKWAREDMRRNGYAGTAAVKKEKPVAVVEEQEPQSWWDAWALCWPDMPVPASWHAIPESLKTELRIKLEDMSR